MKSDLLPEDDTRPEDVRAHVYSASRHYYYDRWLWVQWPWLALANATAASHKARADAMVAQAAAASALPTLGKKAGAAAASLVMRSSSAGPLTNPSAAEGDLPTEEGGGGGEAFLLGNDLGASLVAGSGGHNGNNPLAAALGGARIVVCTDYGTAADTSLVDNLQVNGHYHECHPLPSDILNHCMESGGCIRITLPGTADPDGHCCLALGRRVIQTPLSIFYY